MKITYGIASDSIDVTDICLSTLIINDIITIPCGDCNRSDIFTDPLDGIHKKIFILIGDALTEYDEYCAIKINTLNNLITTTIPKACNIINTTLQNIHASLQFKHGILYDEVPEQKMVVRYLTGSEKVLEIGGNIGRNSLVIASILKNQTNLVTLECDADIAILLTENRTLNNFKFYIESSALSNRKLIQRGWETKPSDTLEEGFKWVNTITLDKLKTKYNIAFDTLVLDCEGAFYYILMDTPEILDNITLIIMENDYWDISHKNYIDEILKKNNFARDYVERGGWGPCECKFYEVWIK
jgi:FkbM family methyltransferase